MAPPPATEDYYAVLEVGQTATSDSIRKSYRRLALLHHPDRQAGSKGAFQLLGRAYETLNSPDARRQYDLIHPSLRRSGDTPESAPSSIPPPPATAAPQSDALREAVRTTKIKKEKEERAAQWEIKRCALESSISELQRKNRRLYQEIENLKSIAAAEVAVEAQKKSCGRLTTSPFYEQVEQSDEKKGTQGQDEG